MGVGEQPDRVEGTPHGCARLRGGGLDHDCEQRLSGQDLGKVKPILGRIVARRDGGNKSLEGAAGQIGIASSWLRFAIRLVLVDRARE